MKELPINGLTIKTNTLKHGIVGLCVNEGDFSIADLSKELNASIPTITKLVNELIEEGFLEDLGKQDTNGGRRPSIYGLNPKAGYFVGIEVRRHHFSFAIIDFKGQLLTYVPNIAFALESSEESFKEFSKEIKDQLNKIDIDLAKVRAYGINLSGRVNNETGYSFSYFIGEDKPIAKLMEAELGSPVFIENDSRAMTYGEYLCGAGNNEKHLLFLNVSWGLGMGMIIDGKLSYGKSGFSGEVGHFPLLDNNQICRCGKIGCLETGASGSAIHRIFMEKLKEGRSSSLSSKYKAAKEITLNDIINASLEGDVLSIEVIQEIGRVLGKAIAGLINIFNPETVIIGGLVSEAKDYLLLPVKAAIQKHSLNIVCRETSVKISKLKSKGGVMGACKLARSKLLGLL